MYTSQGCFGIPRSFGQSEVRLDTANGRGSTNTCIRRYTNTQVNTGGAITYRDSSTLGSSFTVNVAGLYAIFVTDSNPSSYVMTGISRNSVNLTSSILLLPAAERLAVAEINLATGSFNEAVAQASWLGYLAAGDVIRPHGNTGDPITAGLSMFQMVKIG